MLGMSKTQSEGVVSETKETISGFLRKGAIAKSHPAKLLVLTEFLKDVFGLTLEEMLPGIEKKVGSQVYGVKGSIDLLHQGIVVEIKTNLDTEREDAKRQLVKYFQSLREKAKGHRYIGLMSDLVQFEIYVPVTEDDTVTDVLKIEGIDSRNVSPETLLMFLDSAFLSGQITTPSADELRIKFGTGSPTFSLATEDLMGLWNSIRQSRTNKVKFSIWKRVMGIVYGKEPEESTFVDQTYLSLVVRILIFIRISGKTLHTENEASSVLSGEYFRDRGLVNLIEEDFFSWILDENVRTKACKTAIGLANALSKYDLSRADEDLFKELYQEIVEMRQRHGTGEYYTPRWLCEFTLRKTLESYAEESEEFPRILDPACGSGTFLTESIMELKNRSNKTPPKQLLHEILSKICGLDVNPIAVTIARANYAIALGDLLLLGERITIPIFVADSIKLPKLVPTVYEGMKVYDLVAEGRHLPVPSTVFQDQPRRSRILELLKHVAVEYHSGLSKSGARTAFRKQIEDELSQGEVEVLSGTLDELMTLMDEGRNSIWIFVLSNLYAPIMLLKTPFDVLVGNPPWIVMRSFKNSEYQEFLKSQIVEYELLDMSKTQMYTHMEMATLFFCKAADLYLRSHGRIGFIMPISVITGALHHQRFNEFKNPRMGLQAIHSFKGVPGIFSLPPCIIVASKGEQHRSPIRKTEWKGRITSLPRNADLKAVRVLLSESESDFSPVRFPTDRSFYYDRFKAGASLFPRNLTFVELPIQITLGIDSERPLLETSSDVDRVAKKEWKGLRISGRVEKEFVFGTLLGKDIIPFGCLPLRPVVLPIQHAGDSFNVLDVNVLKSKGYPLVAAWLAKGQCKWEEIRTEKSVENYPRLIDRLDHQRLLTNQNPKKRFVVIYNSRGADAVSVVIDRKSLSPWRSGGTEIAPMDFISDYTTYRFETNRKEEAHYVCTILNAPSISKAVKPFQPDGAYGKRDIGPRPFMLRIPEYDENNGNHKQLVDIGIDCHNLVRKTVFSSTGFRSTRNESKRILQNYLDAIDNIVERMEVF